MTLYRFEVITEDQQMIPVIIAADNDERAFELVEIELEKFYLTLPPIEEIVLYEKKKLRNDGGFVIGTDHDQYAKY
ncbi:MULTISPECIES: DUF3906 family protein [Bacillus]|uniref:DUF3906 domain-containing protein n=1 Tax=Bacillus smithii 7_3_47FAA TaxID=665952 RepID=G9QI55_9BACI|nr:DUF3906 family protein [Bacillus smithii]EHL79121.1 hypothetical protein HMPREF1015_01419 [Bacillus smithii 7_3_47FAA]